MGGEGCLGSSSPLLMPTRSVWYRANGFDELFSSVIMGMEDFSIQVDCCALSVALQLDHVGIDQPLSLSMMFIFCYSCCFTTTLGFNLYVGAYLEWYRSVVQSQCNAPYVYCVSWDSWYMLTIIYVPSCATQWHMCITLTLQYLC